MVPQISIHTQRGLIGVDSEPGRFEIRQRQPEVQVETKRPVIAARNRPGELIIDQTLTHNALNGGKLEAFWLRIYAQYQEVARRNLEKIVMDGNRIGDLRIKQNPIPDIALDEFIEGPPDLQVYGEARPDNTKFEYIPNDPDIQVDPGGVEIDVQLHRPEIRYHRGYVKVYMVQYPAVTITPPPAIELMA
ncbi:Putative uncharacterized protein yviE [Thermobacillus xylanilyticus]|jgi:hypothetical protein|uniref:Uncharacterized protein n=1 Tax=Thermobacillus xylanilyticus TaxID=76633 RepID=A0ABN7S3C0_THEXY|nr:DUF6470 family protein [Thermobacillus xylanilyticus]CAG5088515.1 Putative uncharacterized protein yviE [Thermobacillus xylanilyticus]